MRPSIALLLWLILPLTAISQKDKNESAKDKLKKANYSSEEHADTTYGKGGKRIIIIRTMDNGIRIKTIWIQDKNGITRESIDSMFKTDKGISIDKKWMDEKGRETKAKYQILDSAGADIHHTDEYYKDGKMDSGHTYTFIHEDGSWVHKKYNKKKGFYEYVPDEKVTPVPEDGKNKEKEEKPPPVDPNVTSMLHLGGSMVIEDNKPESFTTTGLNAVFTQRAGVLGISGDAGVGFGKVGDLKFTKIQVMGGLCKFPRFDKTTLAPHVYAGLASVTAKSNNYSNTSSAFCMAAGADLLFNVGIKTVLALRADFNPVFVKGGMKNNFRVGAGIVLKNEKKETGTTTNDKRYDQPIFASISGYEFEKPELFKPEDPVFGTAENPQHTTSNNCDGADTFEFYNPAKKPIIGTLIVKNSGECGVHVFVLKINNRPPKKGENKEGKPEGDTKEKTPGEGKEKGGKKAKETFTKLIDYPVEQLQGSDVYSFKIPANTWIRVIVLCTQGGKTCDFTRTFSVTNEKEKVVDDKDKLPQLPVDPPTTIKDSIEKYTPLGNRCMSKDVVFYKITNRDVKEVMTVNFKAVSECGCYFEAYTDTKATPLEGEPKPLEGGRLGEGGNNESPKIAKPAKKGNTEGTEQAQIVPPGVTIYIKGRCPVQNPKPGPCKGTVKITGISYSKK